MLDYKELPKMEIEKRKKVQMNLVGGTIVSTTGTNGLAPDASSELIVKRYIHNVERNYNLDVRRVINGDGKPLNVDSTDLGFPEYDAIARSIIEGVKANNYTQLVVQGTDTMTYAGRFFGIRLPFKDYFVGIVGSMRPPEHSDSDAPKNLEAAFAASQELVPGTYIFMNNGNVFQATRAVKMNTKGMNAFQSINYPLIGKVRKGGIELSARGADAQEKFRRRQEDRSYLQRRIQELYGHDYPIYLDHHIPHSVFVFDQDPEKSVREMEHAYKDGYKVMIIRAYGSGGITPEVQREIETWTKDDRYVLVTTQVLRGRIDDTYEVNRRAIEAGGIQCYDMYPTTVEAKAKLAVALTDTPDDFRRIMYYNFEDELDEGFMPKGGPTTDNQFLEILDKDAKKQRKNGNGKSLFKKAE